MSEQQSEAFDQWAVVEQLGHRRVAGRVREVQLAGAGFLRLDVPATPGHAEQTQYLSPASVYALHPTTEAIATAVAGRCRPEPVHRWELPAAAPEPDEYAGWRAAAADEAYDEIDPDPVRDFNDTVAHDDDDLDDGA